MPARQRDNIILMLTLLNIVDRSDKGNAKGMCYTTISRRGANFCLHYLLKTLEVYDM